MGNPFSDAVNWLKSNVGNDIGPATNIAHAPNNLANEMTRRRDIFGNPTVTGAALDSAAADWRAAHPHQYAREQAELQMYGNSGTNTGSRGPTRSNKDNGVPHGVISFIRGQNPSLSKSQAAGLFKQYQASQKYAGLGNFLQTTGHAHDPATVQAFFAQTVAPYLNQVSGQYQAGVKSGNQALSDILKNAQLPQAERTVLQANQPLIQNAQQQYGNALQGAAVAGPAYDTLINQIQQAAQQQAQTQAYMQQQAALQNSQGSNSISNQGSAALAQLLKS